jgi:hypothetical protein
VAQELVMDFLVQFGLSAQQRSDFSVEFRNLGDFRLEVFFLFLINHSA